MRLSLAAIVLACGLVFAGGAVAGSGTSAAPISNEYIVVLENDANVQAAALSASRLGADVFKRYDHALNGFAVRASQAALAALAADPAVRFISPNLKLTLASQTLPTGVDRIDGDLSSTDSGDGSGSVPINVAVVDTGIDLTHPDLNVVGGKNCGSDRGPSFDDHYGHGTHVAGIIGAKDNGEGVVGVAPGANLWAVRVGSGIGQGSTATALCGVDFVTSTRTDADATNDIAVANMSLGFWGARVGDDGNCGLTNHDALHLAICNSVTAGVNWVVAAGNTAGDFQRLVPASYSEVLTVTAMADFNGQPGGGAPFTCRRDTDDAFASFSSFATLASDQAHTIAAPGRCILSTAAPNSLIWGGSKAPLYGVLSGTSMAAPHAAGTVALCIYSGACAGLAPSQIVQKIRSDADAYNTAHPSYGFTGDPLHPVTGRYYGFLLRAALY
jgi:subtilisin family serine protease